MITRVSSLFVLTTLLIAVMVLTAFVAEKPVERRAINPLVYKSEQVYAFPGTLISPVWDTVWTMCLGLTVANTGNFGNRGQDGVTMDYSEWSGDACADAEVYVYDGSPVAGYQNDVDASIQWYQDHVRKPEPYPYLATGRLRFNYDPRICCFHYWELRNCHCDICSGTGICALSPGFWPPIEWIDLCVGVTGEWGPGWCCVMIDVESATLLDDNDGDCILYDWDNCPNAYNPDQQDSDDDGIGNVCDNCPNHANPAQEDSDSDGLGDSCDVCPYDSDNDIDADSVCGDVDNCPYIYNPDQIDSDQDGIGDSCDCAGIRGNVDGDPEDQINIADLTYLVDYLFRGGQPPRSGQEGNVDGDPGEQINVADLTYLVDYLFWGGPPPPPCPI